MSENRSGRGIVVGVLAACLLTACGARQEQSVAHAAIAVPDAVAPFRLAASLQDIMISLVDVNADAVWESVSEEWDKDGYREHKPVSDEEWRTVRNQAIALQESADLLLIPGRHLVDPGRELEDADVAGILGAKAIEAAITTQRAEFDAFSLALHEVSREIVTAVDKRDVVALRTIGARLDTVCETCHARFWYPDAQQAPTR
ncbi:MAG: hypothetical protein LBT71_06005 [Azoarcus sp.]|jgi:hypothetical protein|nr:hypothetical protein [Azoarcus sp.]